MIQGIPQTPLEHASQKLTQYRQFLENQQIDLAVQESEFIVESYRNAEDGKQILEYLPEAIRITKSNIVSTQAKIIEWESIVAHFQGKDLPQ